MINVVGEVHEERDKNKKKSDNVLDFLKNDSVSYTMYEEIKSLLPDELICEEKTMSSWDKKYTKRMLHKENDKALVGNELPKRWMPFCRRADSQTDIVHLFDLTLRRRGQSAGHWSAKLVGSSPA